MLVTPTSEPVFFMRKILLLFLLCLVQVTLYPASAQKRIKKAKPSTKAYHVSFPKGSTATTVSAYMLGLSHPVTFIIKVEKGSKLTADVKEMAHAGNLRINRIIMPNGESDGPFSKTLQYPIKQKGTYKLIVGGSKMQGDDWKGAFILHVAIM